MSLISHRLHWLVIDVTKGSNPCLWRLLLNQTLTGLVCTWFSFKHSLNISLEGHLDSLKIKLWMKISEVKNKLWFCREHCTAYVVCIGLRLEFPSQNFPYIYSSVRRKRLMSLLMENLFHNNGFPSNVFQFNIMLLNYDREVRLASCYTRPPVFLLYNYSELRGIRSLYNINTS